MKILWIPHAGWHIPQRAQLFCHALSERHIIHVTNWNANFTSLRDYISPRSPLKITYKCYRDGNIIVHRIPRFSPALYSRILRQANNAIFSYYIQKIIKEFQIDVVVGTFVVNPPKAQRLLFDLFDENVAKWCNSFPKYADEISQVEKKYLNVSDAVVAASSVLVDKAEAYGCQKPVYLIPNGINLAEYTNISGQAFRDRLGIKGFLIGSIANHDSREEVSKILYAARTLQNKEITFLIAGRGMAKDWAQEQTRKMGLDNVKFLGYVSPQELPMAVSALNVGLCSYQQTEMDHARSPMRLLAYSAAGVPTVCTDLEEVRRMKFQNVVLVESSNDSFVEGILTAVKMERKRPPEIKDYDLPLLIERYEAVLAGL